MGELRVRIRKRFLLLLIMSLLIGCVWKVGTVHAEPVPPAPGVSAQAAALIDVASGRILYSKQGDQQRLIASLTKIMTAIVAIEQGDPSASVKVSNNAYGKEGSSLYLQLGQEMTLEHMLYGLMLRSGNDAATAIAEHIGGSVEGFAFLMNQKAEELGLENSHFVNPHGLDAEGHYSSANDLATLTAYALKNPLFQEIVKTELKKVPNPNEAWNYQWRNKNKMLYLYEGADGVKTGYTKAAGRGLVSSATREGRQLVVVTIDAPGDWNDHANLLDYGFKHYPLRTVVEKGGTFQNTSYVPLSTFQYPLSEEEYAAINLQLEEVAEDSEAYELGLRGKLRIILEGETLTVVDLVEQGDPQLAQDSATFQSTPWQAKPTLWTQYKLTFRTVWEAMFAPSNDRWAP